MMSDRIKGAAIGAGYFGRFHYEAWSRIPEVELVAVCDQDRTKAETVSRQWNIPKLYTDAVQMLDEQAPDFVDIITPPATHLELCKVAADRNISIICQKPLAPSLNEAFRLSQIANTSSIRFMVHENFRFQPWHRKIKELIDSGELGQQLHSLRFRSRPGDGWGNDAYLKRQPYFREMGRFLIYETGIHFIDTFRFLGGEIREVFAATRRLNPVIQGEDACLLYFDFENGADGLWDANRYNESTAADPRYTFGEFLVEGSDGSIRLYQDGRLTIQALGESEKEVDYPHENKNFGGDCVYATQRHFIDRMSDGQPFETEVSNYIENLWIQEACYESAAGNRPIELDAFKTSNSTPK